MNSLKNNNMKKQKVIIEPFDPNEITVLSIKKHLDLYIEFFDDFIKRFMPNSRINSEIRGKIGEAGQARVLAGTALLGGGVTVEGYELTDEDYFTINKTFNNINQFQKTL
jgi:hypothetical protein